MSTLQIHSLGTVPYAPTFEAMKQLTATRSPETPDQLWLLQHPPVYTLGLAGKPEHLLQESEIPLIKIDRGGQITYHGPGQAVIYVLLDLTRRKLMVRQLVNLMEQAIIDMLAELNIRAERREGAPGVYVGEAKIAALGLKISRSCSYHGLALNVDMDLAPFSRINPCGYEGLACTQLRDFGVTLSVDEAHARLAAQLDRLLGERFPLPAEAA